MFFIFRVQQSRCSSFINFCQNHQKYAEFVQVQIKMQKFFDLSLLQVEGWLLLYVILFLLTLLVPGFLGEIQGPISQTLPLNKAYNN